MIICEKYFIAEVRQSDHLRDGHVDDGRQDGLGHLRPGHEDPDLIRHPQLTDGLHQGLEVVVESRHQHGDGNVRLGQSEMSHLLERIVGVTPGVLTFIVLFQLLWTSIKEPKYNFQNSFNVLCL